MDAVLSTTVLAVAAIVAATVSVCLHVIDQTAFLAILGGFGGATAAAHASGKTGQQ